MSPRLDDPRLDDPRLDDIALCGTWRAAPADDALRRAFTAADFDDESWEPVTVPGHWRSTAAFASSDGPLLYRRAFEAPSPVEGKRAWLVLDGLFYQGDVWLDGTYLGDTEGYFVPHAFEVTGDLAARDEHVLSVEVSCARPTDLGSKRNLTGVFQHWDCLDPDWNPGGIWRPVRVERTGPVRIATLRLRCTSATADAATLALRASLDSDAARTVQLRTTVAGVEHVADQPLARDHNEVEWQVRIEQPALWWPHALGDQPLHDVTVEVRLGDPDVAGEDRAPSDRVVRRTGLRSLGWRRWTLSVNGERLFLKGSNQGPTRMALAEASAEELARDVTLAKDAGLDLLRVHAHVSRPELYQAADEAGVLLWQDLPLQWGYARGVRRQAVRQARAAVDLLSEHPSIAIWCGHNEPFAIDVQPGSTQPPPAKLVARLAAGQALPTWNKTVLDRSIARALEQADGTRPVIAHSGVFPTPATVGTDSHLYFGWYHGDMHDFPVLARRFPRLVRFVSEFGAQAVPTHMGFCDPEEWPDLDWPRLARTHGLQKWVFDRYVPPENFDFFEDWLQATQEYQAELIKFHIEYLRRIKYRPTGGFCHFSFADSHPAISWSVLGVDREPKLGYHALAAACRPVIVAADPLPTVVARGDPLALDVHVVSDLRDPLPGGEVTATLRWDGDQHTWRWAGDIPADECVRVGTIQAVVPETKGHLALDLAFECGELRATNRYETTIASANSLDAGGTNYGQG